MRVISGKCKGRHLKSVPGTTTRPTTDKVKEAIFNRIGPYFDGGTGLDLYSGSGGLGIEGLSRGLDNVIFIDREQQAVNIIKSNLSTCQLLDQSEVYRNDVHRGIKLLHQRELEFDVIFMDPPYALKMLKKNIEVIDKYHLLKKNGILVAEHDENVSLPVFFEGGIERQRIDTYNGKTAISIYTKG